MHLKIASFDTDQRPFLIAEIGNNHEGDHGRAYELVAAALASGVDAVKVQVIDPARLVNVAQAERIAQLSRFSLPIEVFGEMSAQTRKGGACFMASAFDIDSLTRIAPFCDAIKLASGDLTFDQLLAHAATLGQPMVLSTGMSRMAEVAHAVDLIERNLPAGSRLDERLALLHCVSLYPTAIEQANLSAMSALRNRFGLTTGYSDHTLGIEAALVALGMGARVIEKHFTLDKATSAFRDHALSADPAEMTRLASIVRSFVRLQGDGEKGEAIADAAMALAVRRSAVSVRDLPAGVVLTAGDLDFVRPGGGIAPADASAIVGRRLARAVPRHTVLTPAHFE
jgi:N,N'-diacetyllegionaminate synthase